MPKIALDAGHGKDTYERKGGKGVVDNGGSIFHEHTFNANVVSHLKDLLEYNGFTVLLTQPLHANEVPLKERTDLANEEMVDLFWSVHANASNQSSTQGVCAFYWHSSSEGKKLAYLFAKHMKYSGMPLHGNGVHASKVGTWTDLHVIRETNMVAILTENGFMTNEEDLQKMKTKSYQKEVAKIHAQVISEYYNQTFQEPNKQYPSETPSWKREAVDWMYEEGLLTGEQWKESLEEPLPLWAQAIVFRRMMEKLKK